MKTGLTSHLRAFRPSVAIRTEARLRAYVFRLGLALVVITDLGIGYARATPPRPGQDTCVQSSSRVSFPCVTAPKTEVTTDGSGFRYLTRKDYPDALRAFVQEARHGDAAAEDYLGEMYQSGEGVAQNNVTARQWFQKSAAQGDANGENALAFLEQNGLGGPQDVKEALAWYQKAAAQGSANAEDNLGLLYLRGAGVPRSCVTALRWLDAAAKAGSIAAENSFGLIYAHGDCVALDNTTAVTWYERAAVRGDLTAENNLGFMYQHGRGVGESNAAALALYKEAAAGGDTSAENNIGYMYQHGVGVRENGALAARWYSLAAKHGNVPAEFNLGMLALGGQGMPRNLALARHWFSRAAAQGLPQAQRALAQLETATRVSSHAPLVTVRTRHVAQVATPLADSDSSYSQDSGWYMGAIGKPDHDPELFSLHLDVNPDGKIADSSLDIAYPFFTGKVLATIYAVTGTVDGGKIHMTLIGKTINAKVSWNGRIDHDTITIGSPGESASVFRRTTTAAYKAEFLKLFGEQHHAR